MSSVGKNDVSGFLAGAEGVKHVGSHFAKPDGSINTKTKADQRAECGRENDAFRGLDQGITVRWLEVVLHVLFGQFLIVLAPG